MTTTPTSGAADLPAIQRYKIGYHSDDWGQRSSTPSGIPDASGSWVRYADHVAALAVGQQAVAPAEPDEAAIVFAAMASGDWKITRNPPSGYMTDESNARNAWTAERGTAPYCADTGPGNRHWNAPTALEALQAASKEMGIPLPVPAAPPAMDGGEDVLDAARYRVLRDADNQLHEGDICVSDDSFNAYFGEDLDNAVDQLRDRARAAQKEKPNG